MGRLLDHYPAPDARAAIGALVVAPVDSFHILERFEHDLYYDAGHSEITIRNMG
jgi:hypothetical protein